VVTKPTKRTETAAGAQKRNDLHRDVQTMAIKEQRRPSELWEDENFCATHPEESRRERKKGRKGERKGREIDSQHMVKKNGRRKKKKEKSRKVSKL